MPEVYTHGQVIEVLRKEGGGVGWGGPYMYLDWGVYQEGGVEKNAEVEHLRGGS